ncbi:MAG: hypothetical protein CW694_06035 [Candidatus Syntrophoarchaeum sp. WYZ-LMO15]|nr:MAG: hypothetical protein CW694_06035 [Candidatus Syntrophoarchaeum sp. WYZ-LMO15]
MTYLKRSFHVLFLSSPYGRLLKAMREDEGVVRACGRDVMWIRIRTVALLQLD